MEENRAPNIPMLKSMILDMYGKSLAGLSHEFIESTRKMTELVHKKFGKKKFADELLKQCESLYDKNLAIFKSFEKDKELLQGEEECANVMSSLYFDIGILTAKNINIIKQQIGEKVEETEELTRMAQDAFLEFEGMYRKFEKMCKEFIPADAIKSGEMTKPKQDDRTQEPTALGVKDFADFAKRFNDELLYFYLVIGREEKRLKSKHFGKKRLAKTLVQDYNNLSNLAQETFKELAEKTKYAQGDGAIYSTHIAFMLLDLAVMTNASAVNLQSLYFNENTNIVDELAQQAEKAYHGFEETYPKFTELSKQYNIILKGMKK